MPTVFIKGYKFRFYSSDRFEPPHVHVIKAENVAKIWLQPISLQHNRGYNPAELSRILRLTRQHRQELLEAWYDYFSK
jgi:hypothetical protein